MVPVEQPPTDDAAPGWDQPTTGDVALDAFERDDRLGLFAFATAEHRVDYLWILRAFERSRTNYVVLLHAQDVATLLTSIADEQPEPDTVPRLTADQLTPLLDQLYGWHLLDRSYDGARAASLAEYRNRHYVYQFTQLGYRAFHAVQNVLGARLDDAGLSRLVLPELLDDLHALARANTAGDPVAVYRRLTRLDAALDDMAERAARFYLMLSDLARSTDVNAETFLASKDALLVHMREFAGELARFTPKLADAVAQVRSTGVDRLVELAAEADERVFTSPAERVADWQQRWAGLAAWFTDEPGRASEATRLQDGTVTAISALLSMLRRITESRRGGVSRHSQLRHLAAWFTAAPTARAAHALFDVAFGLGSPRHVSTPHPDPELIPTRRSWWEAPPVEVSRTLVETGKNAGPGLPGRIERDTAGHRRLRESQLARQRERAGAGALLAAGGIADRVLSEAETALLLDLLQVALSARSSGAGGVTTTAASDGVRLTLRPAEHSSAVRTTRGVLHLDRLWVTVS